MLDEEDLQGCNLHVSSVFLSCSSGKTKQILEQSWAVQTIQTFLKYLNLLLVLLLFRMEKETLSISR